MLHHHHIFVTCNSPISKEVDGTGGPFLYHSPSDFLFNLDFAKASVLLKTGITMTITRINNGRYKKQKWKIQLQEFMATAELQFIYKMFQVEPVIFWENILISIAGWLQR